MMNQQKRLAAAAAEAEANKREVEVGCVG